MRSFSARSCIRVSCHFSLDRTLVHPLSTWQCNSVRPWALRSRTSLDISPYSHRPYCAGDLTPERCYAKACSTTSPTWALNHLGHQLDFSNSISGTHQKQTSERMTKTTRTYYHAQQLNYHSVLLPDDLQGGFVVSLYWTIDLMYVNVISVREIIS